MQNLLESPQATINVCAKINCPFFNQKYSSSKCCTRYSNSSSCHLTSVFAFQSEQQGLFTANENALASVKRANDGWIAKDRDRTRQLEKYTCPGAVKKRQSQKMNRQKFALYDESVTFIPFSIKEIKLQPISISLFNSIQFENY